MINLLEMKNSKKIVITGGPGSGKTSLIDELENKKFNCEKEIVRPLTLEGKKEGNAHPSWAAREAQKAKSGIVAFAGKKITFD